MARMIQAWDNVNKSKGGHVPSRKGSTLTRSGLPEKGGLVETGRHEQPFTTNQLQNRGKIYRLRNAVVRLPYGKGREANVS
jgi:hypothetical protein